MVIVVTALVQILNGRHEIIYNNNIACINPMDRLTLKGYKDVTGQTGSELARIAPTRGGDFHTHPRWWNLKGTVQYEPCTIFNVTRAAGDIKLVIPTSINTHLEVIWDDTTDNFKFPVHRNVDRIAVLDAATNALVQEYQFSRIAGGSVLKRTVGSLPALTIGTVTITGSATPTSTQAEAYSVAISGTATDATYQWTTTDGSAVISAATAASTDVTFSTSGTFDLVCTVTSALSSDSPVAETLSVTVS